MGTSSWTYLVRVGYLNPWSENYPRVRTVSFGMKPCVLWQWTMELSNAAFATCTVTSTNSRCRGLRHFNPTEIVICWERGSCPHQMRGNYTEWLNRNYTEWQNLLAWASDCLHPDTLNELTLPLKYPLTRLNKYVHMTDHINKYLAGFLILRLFFSTHHHNSTRYTNPKSQVGVRGKCSSHLMHT